MTDKPTPPPTTAPAAGWYPDPEAPGSQRYWNGESWSESRAPLGGEPMAASEPAATADPASPAFRVIVGGAVATLIGAGGPWVTSGLFSKAGIEGDGVITLAIAAIVGLMAFLATRRPNKWLAPAAIVGGALILVVGIIDILDIRDSASPDGLFGGIDVSVGWGLYLTVIAGVILIAGGVLLRRQTPQPAVVL